MLHEIREEAEEHLVEFVEHFLLFLFDVAVAHILEEVVILMGEELFAHSLVDVVDLEDKLRIGEEEVGYIFILDLDTVFIAFKGFLQPGVGFLIELIGAGEFGV